MKIFFVVIPVFVTQILFGGPDERAAEIQAEMWKEAGKAFAVKDIPEKWKGKSAVIISQLNKFEYRKAVMAKNILSNKYSHYRLKLNDQNAVKKYSEMNYDESDSYSRIYVGYKVVKPSGKEEIVDLSKAVKMERSRNGRKQSYNKIAIPGLEPGDILDYYYCEESSTQITSVLHFFDPVIHSLPREYPMMSYKLQFRASRKCYINLKSLNGAPAVKLVANEDEDEQFYTFEGGELESSDDQRWTYPYRDLPTIKFRAAFASSTSAVNYLDVLIGEQKIAKTEVTKVELQQLTASLLRGTYLESTYLQKYDKTNLKSVIDNFEIASRAYYFLRNEIKVKTEERDNWEGNQNYPVSEIKFIGIFNTYLKKRKIPHDIIVAAPRNISTIQNVIMENELEWLIRVKKGKDFLYFSAFDVNSIPGKVNVMLEGTEAYALDGLVDPDKWNGQKITIPVSSATDNLDGTTITAQITEDMAKVKLIVNRSLLGKNKDYYQDALLDYYDIEKEEKGTFKMEEVSLKKADLALKKAYVDKRQEQKSETLKEMTESDYEFKTNEPGNLKIEQTGRWAKTSALQYGFTFDTEDLIKKAGPNYIIDIGKLIEGQVKIEGEELERTTNIYFDNARSFTTKISLDIPNGYDVEGLENLNQKVENQFGGFNSSAKVESGKVVIETKKHYDVNFVPQKEWLSIVSFLNAAFNFSEQKLLLKKK